MEQRILGEIDWIVKLLEQSEGTLKLKTLYCYPFLLPGKPMNPHMLFHNAASNIIFQVLFAKQFDYEDEFMTFFVDRFRKTSKIISRCWGLVSHNFDNDASQ